MPHDSALAPSEDASLYSNKYSLVILMAGALTMAGAAGFARYAFPLLLPDMRMALQATYGQMGLLVTVNNVGYTISSLLGGIVSARYGARWVMFISMMLAGIFSTFFVAFLVAQRGLPTPEAGQIWGLVGLTGAASGIIWGLISDKLGRRFGLATSYYVFFLALAILTFVPLSLAPYVAAALGGLTLTGGMAVTVALLGDSLGARLAGPAFGFTSVFFSLGQVISPSLAGAIIDATGSFASSLIAATAFGFMAATMSLFLRVKGPARGF